MITAKISEIGKKAYKAISAATSPITIGIPPGLGIITSPFLFTSFTVRFLLANALMKIGVKPYTEKKAIDETIIDVIICSCNYLTFSICDLILFAIVIPILSITANLSSEISLKD